MGKKYVIKHIKTKHQDKLAQEREQVGRPGQTGEVPQGSQGTRSNPTRGP